MIPTVCTRERNKRRVSRRPNAGPVGTGANRDAAPGQRQSLARIAAEHGFSSPTRFAQSFRRKYGVYPSEMLRGATSP